MTGRWPYLDRCVQSVVAVKVQASVFDRMLGHFVTGCMVGASGPANVTAQRRGEGSDVDVASDRDRPDVSGCKTEARGALWKRPNSGIAASGHLTVLRLVTT